MSKTSSVNIVIEVGLKYCVHYLCYMLIIIDCYSPHIQIIMKNI